MDNHLCKICESEPSKYVCPRCGIPYCSLKCYRDGEKHLKCSESFYRDCVVESIQTQETQNPEEAKKMKDILKRFHGSYDQDGEDISDGDGPLDSDDDEPLEKRMEGVNLDNADEIWSHLTEEEKADFQRLIRETDGRDVVPEWIPWWIIKEKKKLVEEVTAEIQAGSLTCDPKYRLQHPEQPEILLPIPAMNTLTKIQPNEHVKVGLANVIGAYAWTSRLFSGDVIFNDRPEDVAGALISLSSFLSKDTIFGKFEHAIADIALQACQYPNLLDGGPALQSHLRYDVLYIIRGNGETDLTSKSYVLSALSECFSILSAAVAKAKAKPKELDGHKKNDTNKITAGSSTITKKRAKLVEVLPDNHSGTIDCTTTSIPSPVSFAKSFPPAPPAFSPDLKLLIKAKRKIHYLLAFANEFEVV